MIRLKNMRDQVIELKALGSAAAGNDKGVAIIPFDGFIVGLMAQFGVVGVDGTGSPTQDVKVDINKNEVTLVGTTKVSWDHTALAVAPTSYGSLVAAAPISVSRGDIISFDYDQVLNGTSPTQPVNFVIAIKVSRGQGPLPAALVLGSDFA